ncbi:hypothetical protein DCAR_0205878 [Daucus carota subsp. sativus]|uniref:Cation/H+ exchanger transmembrane domain-containing protein n=1 Tax=Daucus carota subsp. sativus TaxID=79200 RepID=A0A161X057_DAUCS|nr:hypothetical protein DCAR_0205878 [Daucus carota subsp. sativus]
MDSHSQQPMMNWSSSGICHQGSGNALRTSRIWTQETNSSHILPTSYCCLYCSGNCTHAFATLSFIAELFIFLYVGMDALDIENLRYISDSPGTSFAVSSILLGLILVRRATFVFPLSFISKLVKKSSSDKIELKQQVTIWWAGLMRNAVSMALDYNLASILLLKK